MNGMKGAGSWYTESFKELLWSWQGLAILKNREK